LQFAKLKTDDLKEFFNLNNIFKEGTEKSLSFGKFRQIFFPHCTVSGVDI